MQSAGQYTQQRNARAHTPQAQAVSSCQHCTSVERHACTALSYRVQQSAEPVAPVSMVAAGPQLHVWLACFRSAVFAPQHRPPQAYQFFELSHGSSRVLAMSTNGPSERHASFITITKPWPFVPLLIAAHRRVVHPGPGIMDPTTLAAAAAARAERGEPIVTQGTPHLPSDPVVYAARRKFKLALEDDVSVGGRRVCV